MLFREHARHSEHLAPGPPFGQGFVRLRRQEQRQRQRRIAVLEHDREDVRRTSFTGQQRQRDAVKGGNNIEKLFDRFVDAIE